MAPEAFYIFAFSYGIVGWLVGHHRLNIFLPAVVLISVTWALEPAFGDRVLIFPIVGVIVWQIANYRTKKPSSEISALVATSESKFIAADFRMSQQRALERAWVRIRDKHQLSELPTVLNPLIDAHVDFALECAASFGTDAMDTRGEFANVIYRPMSLLPYPAEQIRASCELLYDIARLGTSTNHPDKRRIEQLGDAYATALASIADYVDVPADQIPLDRRANWTFGKPYRT